ncbi:MAG TPA: hypothetical protein VHF22_14235, partial [Planctomycetota bacterium]|nr:hypothetical protein [Planctomycetota bacterium]
FPSLWLRFGEPAEGEVLVPIALAEWCAHGSDPGRLDARIAGAAGAAQGLHVLAGELPLPDAIPAVEEILTRAQRHFDRRNRASDNAQFTAILRRHRGLHDRSRPLARAEHEHALDVWQWVLRLEPEASFEVQVAALFHSAGAMLAEGTLFDLGIEGHARARVAALLGAKDEICNPDPEAALLADAEALSYFSFAADAFIDYHGVERGRVKARQALARLSGPGRTRIARLRLRRDVAAVTRETMGLAA